ncbi:MAG TPA: NAD(P)H-hydrate epimerase [Egibacteraceae bacterium]|nr:NAD(P)H-hydrate epimerase [Egibacteraceae bacterium]
MDVWERIGGALEAVRGHSASPPGGRLGAALALLHDPGDGDLELVFTRRRDDLRSHPGQISFPGGRVDPGETPEQAAVREAREEVALDPSTVTVLGRLPAFYIPPSRFWLHAVLARWDAPHPLVPAEAEVAEVLRARVSALRDPSVWRSVELSSGGHTWAWQLDERHLLWGATAVVTSVILSLIDPAWSGGMSPAHLDAERMVRPWEGAPAARPQAARLHGVAELPLADAAVLPPGALRGVPEAAALAEASRAVAAAAQNLLAGRGGAGGVLVLVGRGGTGAIGAAAAAALAAHGAAVTVVTAGDPGDLPEATRRHLDGLDARPFDGRLPDAALVVDALLGGGLEERVREPALGPVLALRHLAVPVVSVDVPSGVHPDGGLVGEAVTADVTVAIGGVRPAACMAGIEPFVGDLYLASGGTPPLLRLVRPARRPGWRE